MEAVVHEGKDQSLENDGSIHEIQPMTLQIEGALRFVPGKLHMPIVYTHSPRSSSARPDRVPTRCHATPSHLDHAVHLTQLVDEAPHFGSFLDPHGQFHIGVFANAILGKRVGHIALGAPVVGDAQANIDGEAGFRSGLGPGMTSNRSGLQ